MNVNTGNIKATFEFTPNEYYLMKYDGRWCLCYKIDRSYKGKDPDVGMPVIFLDNGEEEELRKYFDEVQWNN